MGGQHEFKKDKQIHSLKLKATITKIKRKVGKPVTKRTLEIEPGIYVTPAAAKLADKLRRNFNKRKVSW